MAFTIVTVSNANVHKEDGTVATGTFSFKATAKMQNGGEIREPTLITVPIVAGAVSVQLPATDDVGTLPTGVTYTVTEAITGLPDQIWQLVVPHANATLDLSTVTPALPSVPAYGYALDSTVMHLAGVETATGLKHFSASATFAGGTPWFDVTDPAYAGGAKVNGQTVADGVMNGTTAVLTSASGKFVAGDVGKLISVFGAGTAGAVLTSTIASYQSATQVTLAAVSATAVAAATVKWGTDDTAALLAAVAACKAAGGGIIDLGLGLSMKNAPLVIDFANCLLQGKGQRNSQIYDGTGVGISLGKNPFITDIVFKDFGLQCTAGHVINQVGVVARGHASSVYWSAWGAGISIWSCLTDGFELEEFSFDDWCFFECSGSNTIPAWNVSCSQWTDVTWEKFQADSKGMSAYFFKMDNPNGGLFNGNLVWRDADFEQPNAGMIWLGGCQGYSIEHCDAYDLFIIGPTTQDLVSVGSGAGGQFSSGGLFLQMRRVGGTLGGGLYDIGIRASTSGSYVAIGCTGNAGNSFAINANYGAALIIPGTFAAATTAGDYSTIIDVHGSAAGGIKLPSGVNMTFTPDTGTATGAALAATLNAQSGRITTEALSGAAGSTTTYTITNSYVTAAAKIFIAVQNGTNTTKPVHALNIQPGAGSFTVDLLNGGGVALNGTVKLNMWVIP